MEKKEKSLNEFKDPQVELLSISVPNNWNTDTKAGVNVAKAIKNKLWKYNTSVKFCFAYKQYFKKNKDYFVFR